MTGKTIRRWLWAALLASALALFWVTPARAGVTQNRARAEASNAAHNQRRMVFPVM